MCDESIFYSFASVNVLCTCSLYNVARVNIPRRIMNRIRKQRIKMAATMYVLGSPCTVLCAKSWGITAVDEELESVNKFHYKAQSCFDIMPYCYIGVLHAYNNQLPGNLTKTEFSEIGEIYFQNTTVQYMHKDRCYQLQCILELHNLLGKHDSENAILITPRKVLLSRWTVLNSNLNLKNNQKMD